jgi:hypothetical protein
MVVDLGAGRQVVTFDLAVARIPIVRLDALALQTVPVDQRVSALATVLDSRAIAVVPGSPGELLDEPRNDFAARARGIVVNGFAKAVTPDGMDWSEPENRARAGLQLVADSLPDCVIELRSSAHGLLDVIEGVSTSLVFFPWDVYQLASQADLVGERQSTQRWAKKRWQARMMSVEDLPRRFDDENAAWPRDDYSRYDDMDPARRALSETLNMGETIKRLSRSRAYGRAIGDAVGNEQRHGWLATDLKLEHFLPVAEDKIAHVDHADDVFLLRTPTPAEIASCIGPLYQQMDYVQWQGFREGYIAGGGSASIEALIVLEGSVILSIAARYCGRCASRERQSGNHDEALRFCSMIETAADNHIDESEAPRLAAWAKLVRGDVLMAANRLPEASQTYRSALADLENLTARDFDVESTMFGGLVNLVLAQKKLGEPTAMLESRAKSLALSIQSRNREHGDHLLEVVATLKAQ